MSRWTYSIRGISERRCPLTDRGGEYQGDDFVTYLKEKGMDQKLNIHDMHHQTGVAEHRNRTIVERIKALLHASGLPKNLWGEAAHHVVWLLNRTTTKAVEGMTPYKVAFGKKPNLKGVREWGEKVYVRVEKGTKLGGMLGREGGWGWMKNQRGGRIYWPDTKAISVERNIYFDNLLANCLDEEEESVNIIKMIGDLPVADDLPLVDREDPAIPPVAINQPTVEPDPVSDTQDTSDAEVSNKCICKPTKKILDLLGGHTSWRTSLTTWDAETDYGLDSQCRRVRR